MKIKFAFSEKHTEFEKNLPLKFPIFVFSSFKKKFRYRIGNSSEKKIENLNIKEFRYQIENSRVKTFKSHVGN